MTSDEGLPAPTLEKIERAIDEVVSALVAYRLDPPTGVARALSAKSGELRAIPIETLMNTDREIIQARDLVEGPVETGLKHSLRRLGKLVFAMVGADGMEEVAERVCALDPDNWGRRMSPVDSAWNGIGSWVS